MISGVVTFVDALDTTGFTGIGGEANVTTTAAAAGSEIPSDGTIASFRGRLPAAPGGSGVVFTLFKNGTATAVTCTIAAASTSCTDSTNTLAVAAGDTIAVRIANSSGTFLRHVRWTARLATT